MTNNNYYQLLNISPLSSAEEIKAAYRTLSKKYHPDKNGGSSAVKATFILILNAYQVLIDPEKRNEYDIYIKFNKSFYNKPAVSNSIQFSGSTDKRLASYEALTAHFSYLLWDIEDFIRERSKSSMVIEDENIRNELLVMLSFIDTWVLTPAGYPDYFMDARKLDRINPKDIISMLSVENTRSHQPFVSLRDYFYNIRKRADKMINTLKADDLFRTVPQGNLHLIDCIMEAQNYCVFVLGKLIQGDVLTEYKFTRKLLS